MTMLVMKRTRAMKASLGKAAALALLATLGGCVSLGGGKPPPELLTLSTARPAGSAAMVTGKSLDAIMVMEPETDKRLSVARVPVRIDAARVAYLKDAVWVERPSRLFRDLLAETLRAKGNRLVLQDDQPAGAVGTRLAGRLLELGYDPAAGTVVARYEALLSNDKGTLATRRFEASVPVANTKPEVIGPALNKAANEVAGQVVEWLSS